MIDIANYKRNFLEEWSFPTLLEQLVEFQNRLAGFYSGYFYIYENGREILSAYFDGAEIQNYFGCIGMDDDGSLYAVWFHSTPLGSKCPVVFLDHDGIASTVIANDLEEFVSLLGTGLVNPGRYYSDPHWKEKVIKTDSLEEFQAWVVAHGLVIPDDPLAVVTRAVSSHPDLLMWINERMSD